MDCFVITELAIYPFSLRIQSLVKEKKGFLLHATAEKKSAWAEVSPLPRFSRESIEEAEKELYFLTQKLPFSIKEISQEYSFCPSVDFALDSLNYTLFSSPSDLPTYPLCAFLSASFEEMKKQIPIIISQGYEHVKVKISHLSSREAHETQNRPEPSLAFTCRSFFFPKLYARNVRVCRRTSSNARRTFLLSIPLCFR
jgi:hypothetical protein